MSLPSVTLVFGGARSGKSTFAEALVTAQPGPWLYVATAEARDEEMRERILRHQSRRGVGWRTVEAPLKLADTLSDPANRGHTLLVDCLTLWLTNVMLDENCDLDAETARLLRCLKDARGPLVLVSNEVGLGIVPETPLGRRFRDQSGWLNQQVATLAQSVVFVAAGLPLHLKRPLEN